MRGSLIEKILDDVTDRNIDAAYLRRRVDDWARRVASLFDELTDGLPEGWEVAATITMSMHEELMRKFNVPPQALPTLALVHRSGATASLVPRALWVIGANGRLDLTCNNQRYIVVDLADGFAPPRWQVCSAHDRRHREPFTREWLHQTLQ